MAATLRAFLDAAGARRATALVDLGPGQEAALVECDSSTAVEGVDPLPLPHVHSFGPLEVDAAGAEVTAPVGAVAHLAAAVLELAGRLEGHSVLAVEFETTDPSAPLTIAARRGEPLLLVLGEEQFPMPPGWP